MKEKEVKEKEAKEKEAKEREEKEKKEATGLKDIRRIFTRGTATRRAQMGKTN